MKAQTINIIFCLPKNVESSVVSGKKQHKMHNCQNRAINIPDHSVKQQVK